MNKRFKKIVTLVTGFVMTIAMNIPVFASEAVAAANEHSVLASKAIAAGIAIAISAAAGAIGMGMAIAKAADGASRQPEAASKIQTILMLGLVFIETAIIYALIVAILIIFVL